MEKFSGFSGSISVIDGISQKNGDFPIIDGHDVLMGDNDERLTDVVNDLTDDISNLSDDVNEMTESVSELKNSEYITYTESDDGDGNVFIKAVKTKVLPSSQTEEVL